MTRTAFFAQAAEELSVTHPSIEPPLRELLLEQAYRAIAEAAGLDLEQSEPDAALLSPVQALAVWRYHRLGSEGLSGESFSGVSQQFQSAWPAEVQRAILRRRKVEWR